MLHAEYSIQISAIARLVRRSHPDQVPDLLEVLAHLVRRRALWFLDQPRTSECEFPNRFPLNGPLSDLGGHLWDLLNEGWAGSVWDGLTDIHDRRLLALDGSLADVEQSLRMVQPHTAIAALAQVVVAARRRELDRRQAYQSATSSLLKAIRTGMAERKWESFIPSGDEVEPATAEWQAGGVKLPRGPIELNNLGVHELTERNPDAPVGLEEATEEFVNWRFCRRESPDYWRQRNRLLAEELGFTAHSFDAEVIRRVTDDIPDQYWHPLDLLATEWMANGFYEIPISFPYPYDMKGHAKGSGGGLETFRLEMIDYLETILIALTRWRRHHATPTTTLRTLWDRGLPQVRPQWSPVFIDVDDM